MERILNQIKKTIEKSNSIGVISHVSPDGDNLGSCTAMVEILKNMSKNVFFIHNDKVPKDFMFLNNVNERIGIEELPDKLDLLIILDSSDENRLGSDSDLYIAKANCTLNIDHHMSNTDYADINYVNRHSTSTGEVLASLISKLEWPINKDAATSLYTAILTDTGSFQYDSVTSETHRTIAKLIDLGADTQKAVQSIYQSKSIAKTMLLTRVIGSIHFECSNRLAIVTCSLKDLDETGAVSSDTEGIVEFVRNIEGVELAVFLKEKEDSVKLSLRSKTIIDCTEIAGKFNGGGHIRASGATITKSLEDAYKKVLEVTKEAFK